MVYINNFRVILLGHLAISCNFFHSQAGSKLKKFPTIFFVRHLGESYSHGNLGSQLLMYCKYVTLWDLFILKFSVSKLSRETKSDEIPCSHPTSFGGVIGATRWRRSPVPTTRFLRHPITMWWVGSHSLSNNKNNKHAAVLWEQHKTKSESQNITTEILRQILVNWLPLSHH